MVPRQQYLMEVQGLRTVAALLVAIYHVWLQRVYELEPFEVEDVVSTHLGYAERLARYVADTSLLVDRAPQLDGVQPSSVRRSERAGQRPEGLGARS